MKKDYLKKLGIMAIIWSCLSAFSWAQDQKISGTVTDENGEPLPGVSVILKAQSTGTITDIDGNYKIVAPQGVQLLFSYIGYLDKEITVGTQTTINIQMEVDVQQLEEVVVVGYGTQRKREVTGSIAKVEGEKLMDIVAPSFEAALQGQAAGVQVIQGSGLAGSASVIRVRGISALSAGGDPLYVIDGIPITQDMFINGDRGAMNSNPLSTINPADIESVEILKDASAAAIYGSRGANGVIIVTTKRGKQGKPTFNFNARAGIAQPARRLDLLNNEEWLQLYQEAWENDGNTGRAPLPAGIAWEDALNTNTDWQDLTTQTGLKQEYNISMSQGNEKLSTYVGLSYSNNESYLLGNSFQRISGRVNLDYKLMDNLKATLTTTLSRGVNDRVFAAWAGGLGDAWSSALPIYPVYNADGTYFTAGANPVRQLDNYDWKTREDRSISTLALEYEPIENLMVRVSGNLDYMDIRDDQFQPEILRNDENNLATRYPTWVTNWSYSATASYNWKANDSNNFTFLLGNEYQKSLTQKYDKVEYLGSPSPIYDLESLDNAVFESTADQEWAFISYFGRVNWNFKDKYIVKASARVDGSSRFGRNNRYGFFPSLGLGYLISEENFFPENDVVNMLKLKASWGITGNADFDNYARFGTFRRRAGDDGNPYNQQPILFPVRLENPNLQWEVQQTIDFGIELGMFENRIVAEASYFDKRSSEILVDRLVQVSTGFERYLENIAEIRNSGVELSLTTRNLVGEFKWTTEINAATLNNEVLDIGATPPDAIGGSGDTRVVEGFPVGVNFLNRFSYVDPANGLPVFLDKEGNETYEFNLEDRVPVGSVVPDITGGIKNTFSYKNFDMSVLFTFTLGGNIYDDAAKRQLGVVSDWNMRRDIVNRWRQPGDVAAFPRLTQDPTTYGGLPSFWNLNTTQFLYDASFGRLRNVTIGYTIPVKSGRIRSARVFINGNNLATFTKYPGPDPEIVRDHNGRQGRNLSPNVTYLTPPQERAYMLGVNIQF